jgi:hypothetical protein
MSGLQPERCFQIVDRFGEQRILEFTEKSRSAGFSGQGMDPRRIRGRMSAFSRA